MVVLRGSGGTIALGPALMVAKRGPTPKKKDINCKEQGPCRCFLRQALQSLKLLLGVGLNTVLVLVLVSAVLC